MALTRNYFLNHLLFDFTPNIFGGFNIYICIYLSTKNVELEDITFENIVCPAVEVYDVYINFRRSKLGKNGLK